MLEQATGLFHHRGSHFWRELGKAAPLFGCIQHAIKSQPLVEELIEGLAGERIAEHAAAGALPAGGGPQFATCRCIQQGRVRHRIPQQIGEPAGNSIVDPTSVRPCLYMEEEFRRL